MSTDRLTDNLSSELENASLALSRWVQRKNDWLESTDINYKQNVEESICTISALNDHDSQLEMVRGFQNDLKMKQKSEVNAAIHNVNTLKSREEELHTQLKICESEQDKELRRLNTTQHELDLIRNKLNQSIHQLNRGLSHYSHLGLEFQRSEGESMQFIFTQIDSKKHNKPYSFTMYVDENDTYNLITTNPILDITLTERLVTQLNEENNISKFVINMRKAFIEYAKNN